MDGPSNTTVFAYDASGKLVAEYSTNVVPVQDAKVSYLTADHLGSPRINTDATGAVRARHDYHPFGEEIFTAQRTTGLNYSADSVRKQFTGYERDTETDLDFAQARMFGSSVGRFTSPDLLILSSAVMPQSWNKYVYSFNSPLVFTDPSGLWPTEIHDEIIAAALPGLSLLEINGIQVGSFSVDFPGTILEANAYQHSMMNSTQTMDQAKAQTDKFVSSNLEEATRFGTRNGVPTQRALVAFGRAMHPVMDSTSPSHRGYQLFSYSGFLLKDMYDMWRHKKGESSITPAEKRASVTMVRERYKETFGDLAFRRAVPVIESLSFPSSPPKPRPKCKQGKGRCVDVTVIILDGQEGS